MAYGDVKEHFSKGELNDLWNFIEFVGEIFPSKRDNIEKLKLRTREALAFGE